MKVLRKIPMIWVGLVALAGSGLLLSSLHAQQPGFGTSPTGTWIQTIALQGQQPFKGLVTFNADGTVTDTTQSDTVPPDTASPGHGVWQPSAPNAFRIKVDKFLFLFGSPGTPDGMNVSTGTVRLQDENNFKASGLVEVYSTSGQEVLTIPFTSEGQRVTVP